MRKKGQEAASMHPYTTWREEFSVVRSGSILTSRQLKPMPITVGSFATVLRLALILTAWIALRSSLRKSSRER